MEETRFVVRVKLAISFPRVLAFFKKSIKWKSCWNIEVFEDSKGFFTSSMLIQLELLFVEIILGDFDIILDILLEKR